MVDSTTAVEVVKEKWGIEDMEWLSWQLAKLVDERAYKEEICLL